MPRQTKRKEVENFALVYEEQHGHLPNRDEILEQIKVSDGTAGISLYSIKESRKTIGPIKFSKAQKNQVEMAKKIARKELEKEFEAMIQLRVKEYIQKYMPDLEARREELSKKIETYQKLTDKRKAIFTIDEFKTILMCLHPDGERTKERLEEAFVSFKSQEGRLTKK